MVTASETTYVNTALYDYSQEFEVWYGRLDNRPIEAPIGDTIAINVYVAMRPSVYVSALQFSLGVKDSVIDSLMGEIYGRYYYPFTAWDTALFCAPDHNPPNPPGWSNQSFLGIAYLTDPPNPWLNITIPAILVTYVLHIKNDPSLIGDTVDCFGPGVNILNGTSLAADTLQSSLYTMTEHYSRLHIVANPNPCSYTPGDINGDGQRIGGDVTFGVRYFKGTGNQPLDSCYMDSTGSYLYVAGDANGNCEFRGSDITRLVAFFKGTAPLGYCHWFPPPGR
jgi:hypothetical protein